MIPCPCCAPCSAIITTDAFTRETLGDDYTVVHATATMEDGRLRLEDALALVIRDDVHPDGDGGSSQVSALITPDAAARARLLGLYEDDANYVFLEIFEDTCPKVRLGVRVASVETWISDERPLPSEFAGEYPSFLCVEPGTLDTATGHDTGTTLPTWAFTTEDNGGWNNLEGALQEDDDSLATFGWIAAGNSDFLYLLGFLFSDDPEDPNYLPDDATIDGVEVTFSLHGIQEPVVLDFLVQLVFADPTLEADNKAGGDPIPFGEEVLPGPMTYGGSTDNWGETFLGSDLKHPLAGVALVLENTSEFEATASVDACAMRVWYHGGDGSPGKASAIIGTGSEWPGKLYLEGTIANTVRGDQVGMEVTAGEALFDDFAWSPHKSQLTTNCPECAPPCVFFADASPPTDACHWTAGILNHLNPDFNEETGQREGVRIQFTALPDTPTDAVRGIVGGQFAAEVVSDGTDGTLTLYRGATELASEELPGYDGETEFTLEICFEEGGIVASALGVTVAGSGEPFEDEHEVGISGDATFTNFEASSLAAECAPCGSGASSIECDPPCIDGLFPEAVRVRIRLKTSVASLSVAGCDFGPLFDGTYILTAPNACPLTINLDCGVSEDNCYGAGTCGWSYPIPFYVNEGEFGGTCELTATDPCAGFSGFRQFALFAGIEIDVPNDRHRLVGIIAEFPAALGDTNQRGRYVGAWRAGSADLDCMATLPYGVLTYDADDGVYLDYEECFMEILPA